MVAQIIDSCLDVLLACKDRNQVCLGVRHRIFVHIATPGIKFDVGEKPMIIVFLSTLSASNNKWVKYKMACQLIQRYHIAIVCFLYTYKMLCILDGNILRIL